MSDDAFERKLRALLRALTRGPEEGIFNPYRDCDRSFDRADAPAIRRRNLRHYLRSFREARWILVGEAAGYNGCRFSGVPFTGEDFIVGEAPLAWTTGLSLARSSQGRPLSSEMSAKIVWGGLGDSRDFVLWNAVPWHPHRPGEPLSNRKPTTGEVEAGRPLLEAFLELFEGADPVAVGRVSEKTLEKLGHTATYVRHPSMGGKPAFLAGLARLRKQARSRA